MPIPIADAVATVIGSSHKIWDIIGVWDLFERTVHAITGTFPKWVHGIQVKVAGGPKAHIRRLWYLALSACFGRYRDALNGNAKVGAVGEFSINAFWAVSDKAVSIELVYEDNGWGTGKIFNSLSDNNAPNETCLGRLGRGPEQLTIGGSWPLDLGGVSALNTQPVGSPLYTAPEPCVYTSGIVAAVPYTVVGSRPDIGTGLVLSGAAGTGATWNPTVEWPLGGALNADGFMTFSGYPWGGFGPLFAGGADWSRQAVAVGGTCSVYYSPFAAAAPKGVSLPTLPDDGRIITTVESNDPLIQPPRPVIDGQTRSSLVSLVAAAILQPCYLPQTPPCTGVPGASSSRYFWVPGGGPVGAAGQQALINAAGISGTLAPNIGPDGYPTKPVIPAIGTAGDFRSPT